MPTERLNRKRGRVAPGTTALLVAGAGLLWATNTQAATIVADFTAGNTTASVDGYAGKTGSGWTSAWTASTSYTSTNTVANTTQLNGGGNYLHIHQTRVGSQDGSTRRKFDSRVASGATSTTAIGAYQITFDFRVDTPANNWIDISATSSSEDYTVGGDVSWSVRAGAVGSAISFQNGMGTTNSTLNLALGAVYSVTINLGENTSNLNEYTATITDGANTWTSGTLLTRVAPTVTPWLNVGYRQYTGGTIDASIDNIHIGAIPAVAIPSPETGAALLGLATVAYARRRHR